MLRAISPAFRATGVLDVVLIAGGAYGAYYQYEPWHWRFVGTVLATKLHKDRMNFYNLSTRD